MYLVVGWCTILSLLHFRWQRNRGVRENRFKSHGLTTTTGHQRRTTSSSGKMSCRTSSKSMTFHPNSKRRTWSVLSTLSSKSHKLYFLSSMKWTQGKLTDVSPSLYPKTLHFTTVKTTVALLTILNTLWHIGLCVIMMRLTPPTYLNWEHDLCRITHAGPLRSVPSTAFLNGFCMFCLQTKGLWHPVGWWHARLGAVFQSHCR